MIALFIGQTIYTARVLTGCLPLILGEIFIFHRQLSLHICAGFLMLILCFKCLQTFKFHLVARLDDDFWSIYLSICMIMLETLLISYKYMIGLQKTTTLKLLSCIEMDVVETFEDDYVGKEFFLKNRYIHTYTNFFLNVFEFHTGKLHILFSYS